ncbi:MAG TPA: PLP-dependent aminotransferase family protein [Pseudonocardiaceae bacterium]|nr:PLP-dependent aminotransferase family protein [Pseudonocardiaceae bacterium]
MTTGRLAPDTRLPSSRALAGDLGVARNTVAGAYGQLVAEGWLTAKVGAGTRVATQPRATTTPTTPRRKQKLKYDLIAGAPTLTNFPRTEWLTAARRALATAPADTFGYTDPRGQPALRDALAGYLARARGVRVTPDQIVVCSGFTQGLSLLSQVLAARGHTTMAVEAYGHQSHRDIARRAGLEITTVPVDEAGADIGDASDCVLLTPAHQFPLGMPLAAHRRTQAAAGNALVIEDDYDGEFRYDRHPMGALQALAPAHVVYAGTASKSLAPGIRVAWLVLPPHLVDDVAEAKRQADGHCGAIDQLTLAEFIESGGYDRHIRRCRLAYRRRRDRLIGTLRDTKVTGVAAGLHAVVELPDGVTENEVITRAAAHGLALEGLSEYHRGGRKRAPALVVGYATPTDPTYTAAIARLGAVLAERPGK